MDGTAEDETRPADPDRQQDIHKAFRYAAGAARDLLERFTAACGHGELGTAALCLGRSVAHRHPFHLA
ncbi:hypothetical protein, partial [Thermoflexus sp.]|uniref:hypothetical protein n=1 Tax=Thermoflexus sp. TaxID=1969742 RepID=UPI003329C67A